MGTTWNNNSTSAAGVISASMKRVFSFIERKIPKWNELERRDSVCSLPRLRRRAGEGVS
jgi:hypothetical protein